MYRTRMRLLQPSHVTDLPRSHRRRRGALTVVGGTIASLLLAPIAFAAVIPGQVVVSEGGVVPGAGVPLATVGSPFVEPSGVLAFRGTLMGGEGFIFRDGQAIWLNSDDMVDTLTGGEETMGTAPGGAFIYSPAFNGEDAVYTHLGLLSLEGTPAPDQPMGTNSTFHSRPQMTTTGQAWWVMGLNFTGGTNSEARALVRSPTALEADTVVVLQTGDLVGGLAIDTPGIDFDYQPSQDDQHLILVVDLVTGSTNDDGGVAVDGMLVAQEAFPSGQGDNWDNFDAVAIDNGGHYAFSGDTDGPIASDEFIAYDGLIVLREGDVVGGIPLNTATVRLVSLNDSGMMAHAWQHAGGETVFYSCNPADLLASSIPLMSVGDELDLNGDGAGDGLFVTDLNTISTTPTRAMSDGGAIFVDVDLELGGMTGEAMIELQATCCGNGLVDPGEGCDDGNQTNGDGCSAQCLSESCGNGVVDAGEECDDGNADDTDACTVGCLAATCGDGNLWVGMEACDDGNASSADACLGDCSVASCGDGFTWAGVEECDDGNLDDTDDCLSSCVAASCGDGFVQAGVETCDDGNLDDTDDCPGSCQPAVCGDGFTWAGMEECDDGNAEDIDACLSSCESASCGDGIVWMGVEMCDDGNRIDRDGCPSTCASATCGDGFVQMGEEDCDDGNLDDTDACLSSCMNAMCGDGFLQAGVEDCDDGDFDDGDDCPSTCVPASCGDGFLWIGMEECDDGNDDDTDACPTTCVPATCGDGFVQEGVEACDDGNDDDTDACSSDCEQLGGADSTGGEDTTGDGSTGEGVDDTTGGGGTTGGGLDDSSTGALSDGSTSGSGGSDTGSGGAIDDDGGCNCSSRGSRPGSGGFGLLMLMGLGALGRRRRRGA